MSCDQSSAVLPSTGNSRTFYHLLASTLTLSEPIGSLSSMAMQEDMDYWWRWPGTLHWRRGEADIATCLCLNSSKFISILEQHLVPAWKIFPATDCTTRATEDVASKITSLEILGSRSHCFFYQVPRNLGYTNFWRGKHCMKTVMERDIEPNEEEKFSCDVRNIHSISSSCCGSIKASKRGSPCSWDSNERVKQASPQTTSNMSALLRRCLHVLNDLLIIRPC